MDEKDIIKQFWREVYAAHIRAGLARSNARDAADDAVREYLLPARPWNATEVKQEVKK